VEALRPSRSHLPAPERTCAGHADAVNTEHARPRRRVLRDLRSLEMSPPIAVPCPIKSESGLCGPCRRVRKPLVSPQAPPETLVRKSSRHYLSSDVTSVTK
jgi:hypothetical protein